MRPRIEKSIPEEPKPIPEEPKPIPEEANNIEDEQKTLTPSTKPIDMDDPDYEKSATESAATSDERVRDI